MIEEIENLTGLAYPTGPKGDTGEKGEKGDTGAGIPTGGTTGQVLAKRSDSDYDTEWVDQSRGIVGIYNSVEKNAGSHNSLYRGKDITDLFYNGTLSTQIANGTFDDIFIGDYIIGQESGRKYLVADINYRLHTGDTECTTPHVLMIPEKIMGKAQMNSTSTSTGAYVGSNMYTTNLTEFKNIIKNDFGNEHVLVHTNILANAISDKYETGGAWYNSDIELMNEIMVCGEHIMHNSMSGTGYAYNYELDNSQIALFRLRHEKIVGFDDEENRQSYWLRTVADRSCFSNVTNSGVIGYSSSTSSFGVRPAFLIY